MKEIEQIKTIKEFNKEIEIINNKLDHLYYKHEKVRNFKAYLHEYFSFSLFDIMIYPFIFLFVSLLDLIYWIGYLIKYRDSYKLGIRDVKTKIYELGDRLEILINKKNQLLLIPIEVCIGKSLPNIKYLKSHSFGYGYKHGNRS